MDLNPDLKKEAEHARELSDMRNEMAEIKRMLAASLGTRQKEEL